jgi:uncharacterized membrane protein YphA (DoxX/SURF4 family)
MTEYLDPIMLAQLSISSFVAIVFLQSGIDKVTDWSGNLGWLKGHFSKTFISGMVTPLLGIVTLVELAAGAMGVIGVGCLLCCADPSCAYIAVLLSLVSYLMLIFGQRIAKDYDGAKTIAIYFGVSLVSLMFF